MGADLYIEKVFEANKAKYEEQFHQYVTLRDKAREDGDAELMEEFQAKVEELYDQMYAEGYFRDSYNATSVLNQLGLSWWQDVIPMLDSEGNLTGANLIKLRDMVQAAEVPRPTKKALRKAHAKVDDGDNSPEAWHRYYTEKRDHLIDFLNKAIMMEEPIYCSL